MNTSLLFKYNNMETTEFHKELSQFEIDFYLEHGLTAERIKELSPEEYTPYKNGIGYLKKFYDIKTKDGNEYLNVYPNGGCFYVKGKQIQLQDIAEFRISKSEHPI